MRNCQLEAWGLLIVNRKIQEDSNSRPKGAYDESPALGSAELHKHLLGGISSTEISKNNNRRDLAQMEHPPAQAKMLCVLWILSLGIGASVGHLARCLAPKPCTISGK